MTSTATARPTGCGGTRCPGRTPTVADLSWQIGHIADYTGDGKPDIAWRQATSGANARWVMDGVNYQYHVTLSTVADANWKIAPVGQ